LNIKQTSRLPKSAREEGRDRHSPSTVINGMRDVSSFGWVILWGWLRKSSLHHGTYVFQDGIGSKVREDEADIFATLCSIVDYIKDQGDRWQDCECRSGPTKLSEYFRVGLKNNAQACNII